MLRKAISMLLLISTAFILLTSCGNSESPEEDATANGRSTAGDIISVEESTTQDKIFPELPVTTFDGYEFKMFVRGLEHNVNWEVMRNIFTAEETGEPLNDAHYLRNRKIEDQYNITISATGMETAKWTKTICTAISFKNLLR